jgi:carboxymethylenebutenolidase
LDQFLTGRCGGEAQEKLLSRQNVEGRKTGSGPGIGPRSNRYKVVHARPPQTSGGIMRRHFAYSLFWVLAIFGGCVSETQGPPHEIFSPARGRGAVIVVASGYSGPGLYRDFCSKLAEKGYYTVLMDGKDLIDPGSMGRIVPGAKNLEAVIAAASASPQALPGKVALVGFSIGGAGVLAHGAGLKEQVAGVVAYYPAIATTGWNMTTFAARLQTPVLLLAGEKDSYEGCCWIKTMRELAEAPKTVPFELVTYPEAGHCFNIEEIPIFNYRPEDAADAWERTVAFLNRLLPPGGR